MAIPVPSSQGFYTTMRELKWSSTGKAIARRRYERILQQELDAAIQSTKARVAKISQASELWELERHRTQLGKEIDRKYQYKHSTLVLFFAACVREGKLDLEDLHGLADDRLRYILQRVASSEA